MVDKKQQKTRVWRVVSNIILILGMVVSFGFGCQQINATSYSDRVLLSCEVLEDESYWGRIETSGTDFTDCNHYMGIFGSVVSGNAYNMLYTSFCTSAIFLGLLIVYNKK